MGTNGHSVPPEQRQTPPIESSNYTELEKRVRAMEDKLNKADGVLAVLRLFGPPVLIVVGGIIAVVIAFLLGQSSATPPP